MGFEDELADIVRKQTFEGHETLSEALYSKVIEYLKLPQTYGYLVYVTEEEGKQFCGLVALGQNAYGEAQLAHAHRKANALIDDLFNHTECEHDDDTN